MTPRTTAHPHAGAAPFDAAAEERLCRRALEVALIQARHAGLFGDAVEDCALGFVQHILEVVRTYVLAPPARLDSSHGFSELGDVSATSAVNRLMVPEAWLLRCAINWTKNACRAQRRRRHHECSFAELTPDAIAQDVVGAFGVRSAAATSLEILPEFWLWRAELLAQVHEAMRLAGLTAAQRRLLDDYYLRGAQSADLAAASARTANAVRQELWSLRQRLRAALTQQMGWDTEEVEDYLLLLGAVRRRTGNIAAASPRFVFVPDASEQGQENAP
jgi:DNA-directed RNA polymerase specialized sigma24 family protein